MQHPLSKESLLISYEIENGKQRELSFIPIKCNVDGSGTIYLAKEEEREAILNSFRARSEEILQPGFIESKYSEFARSALQNYLLITSPFGKWFSRFDRYIFKGRLMKRLYSKRKLLALQNIVECEAHRELILAGFQGKSGE
jgi:poly-gamma-glutamate synthesis protein (capsule biosynthesis protein)